MAFFVRPLTVEEKMRIYDFKKQYPSNIYLLTRLDIILLSNERLKSGKISAQLHIGRETVSRWIQNFNQSGLKCFERYLHQDIREEEPTEDEKHFFVRSLTSAEQDKLQYLLKVYQGSPRTQKHLQTIFLSSQGLTISEIAAHLSFSYHTFWRIQFWIVEFNNRGMDSLETRSDKDWLKYKQKILIPANLGNTAGNVSSSAD